jgi:hypothetical protein
MRPFEYLFLRRMKFDYISPPICEAMFSSTGEPTILLETFERDKVQGLELESDSGLWIRWSAYPGALCYSVYQADGPEGPWVLVAECVDEFQIIDEENCYSISAITPEGESNLSDPICPSTITCPEWITALGGSSDETCGSLFSLTVEAAVTPADVIYYEWKKDGNIVFAETKIGASTLVINSLVEADAGLYHVDAYFGEDCKVSTEQTLTVTGCGGGGGGCSCTGVMPDSFMEDCEELVASHDGDFPKPSPTAFFFGAGVYELRYEGGSAYECTHAVPTFDPADCADPGQSCQSNAVWSYRTISGQAKIDFGFGFTQAVAFGAQSVNSEFRMGGGNDCLNDPGESAVAAALETAFPGKKSSVLGPGGCGLIGWAWDSGAEKTYPGQLNAGYDPQDLTCAETCGGAEACPDDACNPATCTTSVTLYRIRKFIAQPTVLTIQGWGAAMKALLIGAINPKPNVDVGYEWAGKFGVATNQVDEYPGISEFGISYAFSTTYPYPGIGQIDMSGSSLWASVGNPDPADDKWQLTLFASWLDQDDVWQAETLWRGHKLSGTTGAGAYCWEASFIPSLETQLPCIVLV